MARTANATVETKYRVCVHSMLLDSGIVQRGDALTAEQLGDQLESHVEAGHVEPFEDVQVVSSDPAKPKPDPKPAAGEAETPKPASRAKKKPSEKKPRAKKPAAGKAETPKGLKELEGMDDALLAALDSAGVRTIDDLKSLKPEEVSELGGISNERATKILEAAGG